MPKLTLKQRRAVVAIVGIPSFFCAVNDKAGLHLLGGYDSIAGGIGLVIAFFLIFFVALPGYPDLAREWVRKHRRQK